MATKPHEQPLHQTEAQKKGAADYDKARAEHPEYEDRDLYKAYLQKYTGTAADVTRAVVDTDEQ